MDTPVAVSAPVTLPLDGGICGEPGSTSGSLRRDEDGNGLRARGPQGSAQELNR
jgi:hypothetical protein